MSARQPRFEVVHIDAGWFARFFASNGRKEWQTEVYARRRAPAIAVILIRDLWNMQNAKMREIDERTTA